MSQLPAKITFIGRTYQVLALLNLCLAGICYWELGHGGMAGTAIDLLLAGAIFIALVSTAALGLAGTFLLRRKRPALLAAIMISSLSAAWQGFFCVEFLLDSNGELGALIFTGVWALGCLFHLFAAAYMIFGQEVRQAFR